MTVSLSPNGVFVMGDNPEGGTSAFIASQVLSIDEERITPGGSTYKTLVRSREGVSSWFDGKQGNAIYQLVKDKVIP